MSNLSDLLPSGGGSKSAEFVASGTLSNGQVVILNSNGTVSAIAATGPETGTPTGFDTGSGLYSSATYDTLNNKIVIAYQDVNNSSYGTAVVGTVSGTSISFGTPVVFESAEISWNGITFDSNSNTVVIAFTDRENSNYGTSVVGTVSGTSISFGTAVVFHSSNNSNFSTTFDSVANKVVIIYKNGGSADAGTAIVGTVSGTSISFGSAVVFNGGTSDMGSTFDTNSNKVVISYRNMSNSSYGTGIVGTVSGTSISFGTAVVFQSSSSYGSKATFDNNSNKVVVAYENRGSSSAGTAVVGTVSGTAISFGTPVVFATTVTTYLAVSFDSSSNQAVIGYSDVNNSYYGTAKIGTVSGTSISFGSANVFASSDLNYMSSAFDSDSNSVIFSYNDKDASIGKAAAFKTSGTTLTSTNFVGITDAAISSAATGTVTIKGGISANVTSLTPAAIYYVQGDGTISTVTTAPAVRIGQALSSTSINLEFTA